MMGDAENLAVVETTSHHEPGVADEKIQAVKNDDVQSTLSLEESKTNFWILPVPKNCRVSPTKPYHFNLATNILFGFASTFTVSWDMN